MAAPIPSTIGRYEIISLIGRGGMGVLYRAKDPSLEREVALKMMLVDFSFDTTARERFEREAKAVARLQHHNVVTIHELGQSDGAPYIVMELLSGEDLEAVMHRSEPLPLAQKLEIVAQLCEGLAYAHEQGIVHRDIKPGNVRVLEDGTVKILDFGIAKFAQSSMTQSGAIMGTAHYMAPEQILGNPIDGRADLFSVGVLLHELLTGEKPFAGDSATAVVYQIVHTEAPSIAGKIPGLPEGLDEIVARALKKDPNERYSRASDMASDLRLVRMMIDLPLTQGTPSGEQSAAARPAATLKLHATGVLPKTAIPDPVVKAVQPAKSEGRSKSGLTAAIVVGALVLATVIYFVFLSGGTKDGTGAGSTAGSGATATPGPTTAPAPPTGPALPANVEMAITSVPAGAHISMNGSDTGKTTPSTVSIETGNPATVELSFKGYEPLTAKFSDGDLRRGNKEFRLARQPSPVRLSMTGTYPFEIVRGGNVLSASALHHELTIPPGAAPVFARSAEYLLNEAVPLDFQKPDAEVTLKAPGVLAVFASVETCSIVVDGQDIGFPPLPRKSIAAGPHTVTLKCKDGKEDSRKIVVAPGERITVTFGLPRP